MIESITLRNLSTLQEISINMDSGPYWMENLTIGPVEGKHHTIKYPEQVGEYRHNTSLGTRDISLVAWSVDDPDFSLEQAKGALSSLCNPTQELEIAWKQFRIGFFPDSSIKYSKDPKENNEVMCKFMIQGTSFYPMWELLNRIIHPLARIQYNWAIPFSIPEDSGMVFGIIQPTLLATILNNGSIPIGGIITLKANGHIENPTLIHVEKEETIILHKSLEAGETIVIDTRPQHRSIRGDIGEGEQNYLGYLDFGSSWIMLHPGENTLSIKADVGMDFLEANLEYSPSYFEV